MQRVDRGTRPQIRLATAEDLDALIAIERAAYAPSWSRQVLARALDRGRAEVSMLAELAAERPVAFVCTAVERDEVQVLSLATHPQHRRRGHAGRLLARVLARARASSARFVSLEVRRSNLPAQQLYQCFGFQVVGVRPRYYAEEGEDALKMMLEVGQDQPR